MSRYIFLFYAKAYRNQSEFKKFNPHSDFQNLRNIFNFASRKPSKHTDQFGKPSLRSFFYRIMPYLKHYNFLKIIPKNDNIDLQQSRFMAQSRILIYLRILTHLRQPAQPKLLTLLQFLAEFKSCFCVVQIFKIF